MTSDLDMIKARQISRYIKRSRLASSHYDTHSEKPSVLNTEKDEMERTSRFLTQHFSMEEQQTYSHARFSETEYCVSKRFLFFQTGFLECGFSVVLSQKLNTKIKYSNLTMFQTKWKPFLNQGCESNNRL